MTRTELNIDGSWVAEDMLTVSDDGLSYELPDGTTVTIARPELSPAPTDRCNGFRDPPHENELCGLSDGWGRGFNGDDGRNPGRCKWHWEQPYRSETPSPEPTVLAYGENGYGAGVFPGTTA